MGHNVTSKNGNGGNLGFEAELFNVASIKGGD